MNSKKRVLELFGKYIRQKRIDAGLSQSELGKAVGYPERTAKQGISQIERGICWIPKRKLDMFIEALSLDDHRTRILTYQHANGEYEELLRNVEALQDDEFRQKNPSASENEFVGKTDESDGTELEKKLANLKRLFEKNLIDQTDFREMKRELLKKHL